MAPDSGRERRRLKRVVQRVAAKFTCGALQSTGHIKNLSKGGLFMRTASLPPVGEIVQIIILTRSRQKIEVVGRVCWSTEQLRSPGDQLGFAIEFTDTSEEYREFFADLLVR